MLSTEFPRSQADVLAHTPHLIESTYLQRAGATELLTTIGESIKDRVQDPHITHVESTQINTVDLTFDKEGELFRGIRVASYASNGDLQVSVAQNFVTKDGMRNYTAWVPIEDVFSDDHHLPSQATFRFSPKTGIQDHTVRESLREGVSYAMRVYGFSQEFLKPSEEPVLVFDRENVA